MADWQSYLCRVNGEIASVFVDLALAAAAPLAPYPRLAWLWIRINQPREDGLSSDEEFDALCRFEDALEAGAAGTRSAVYAGRITTRGRREFYFYLAEGCDWSAVVEGVLGRHPGYAWQAGEKNDRQWQHYAETLLPGPDGREQIRKRESGR